MPSTPNTVSEAVNLLIAEGYDGDLDNRGATAQADDEHSHALVDLVIERQYRFEGDSNPDDEAIVLGVTCTGCDLHAVVVSAFGPDADPALFAHLRHPG